MTKLSPDQKDKRQAVRTERKAAKQKRRELWERNKNEFCGKSEVAANLDDLTQESEIAVLPHNQAH
jgi:hypothetical protein